MGDVASIGRYKPATQRTPVRIEVAHIVPHQLRSSPVHLRCALIHVPTTTILVAEPAIKLPHSAIAVATAGQTGTVPKERAPVEVVTPLRKCTPIVPVPAIVRLTRTTLVLAAVRESRIARHAAQHGVRVTRVLRRSGHSKDPQTKSGQSAFHDVFQGFSPNSKACGCMLFLLGII